MPSVHESQRQFLIGDRPQEDYLTPTDNSDPENFLQLQLTDKDFADLTATTEDNKEDAHGSEFATEEYLEAWDVEASHGLALSSEMAGHVLLDIFGSVASSQPAAVSDPTVYQHLFTPQDPTISRQLPARTFIEIIGLARNCMHPSMVGESLSLKGDGVKRIDTSFQYIGSGREIIPSGLSVAQAKAQMTSGLHYFFNSQATATIADAGTLLNATNLGAGLRFNSWSFDYKNNHMKDEGYRPGAGNFQTAGDATSGAVRSECLFGVRDISASQVVRLYSQSDEMAALKARKDLDWKLQLTGGIISNAYAHKLIIHFAKTKYSTVRISGGGLVTEQIQMRPFDDGSGVGVVGATLINTVPSYTD